MPQELKLHLQVDAPGTTIQVTLQGEGLPSVHHLHADNLFVRVQELVNTKLQVACNQVSLEAKQLRGK
jgi:intracellular sulfur oxidation DsrE/DsrF family protein